MVIQFSPNVIYTITDLDAMFEGSGINWRKLFEHASVHSFHDRMYYGFHIIDGLENAPSRETKLRGNPDAVTRTKNLRWVQERSQP